MFQIAKPVFLKGLHSEMNVYAVFSETIGMHQDAELIIAGASFYKVWINGSFVHYGPARAPHGCMRVDKLPVGRYLNRKNNTISVHIISYNCNSFNGIMQPGYLLAEVVADGNVICATGRDFSSYRNRAHTQKVMRYSYQRQFSEVYDVSKALAPFPWEVVPLGRLRPLERRAPIPDFSIIHCRRTAIRGAAALRDAKTRVRPAPVRYIDDISDTLLGFHRDEISEKPFDLYHNLTFLKAYVYNCGFTAAKLRSGEYAVFDMGQNQTGFIQTVISVAEEAKLILSFSEYLNALYVDIEQIAQQVNNTVQYTLPAGEYTLETIEPYGFRWLQATLLSGSIEIREIGVRSLKYPVIDCALPDTADVQLRAIFAAGVETFRQNSVDVFMDCPTRERGGWLCDSYFTAQTEYALTGSCELERAFLENFARAAEFPNIPKGMIPMVYPGDHLNGSFIPQWSLWFILELDQYLARDTHAEQKLYRSLCVGIIEWFLKYQNREGLIENLPGWNFVEWSKANQWIRDVNFPTNMLFFRALQIVGSLYNIPAYRREAKRLRDTVIQYAFDGEFFVDNALRNPAGELIPTGNISEACQYYALRFGIADIEKAEYAKLKHCFFNIFGCDHNRYEKLGKKIEPANALMGVYLRLELLREYKAYALLQKEIKAFFGDMSSLTGTLWENTFLSASLNHGFASYVCVGILAVTSQRDDTGLLPEQKGDFH